MGPKRTSFFTVGGRTLRERSAATCICCGLCGALSAVFDCHSSCACPKLPECPKHTTSRNNTNTVRWIDSPGASDIRRKFKWRTQANLWRKFAWLKLKCFFSKSPHHFRSNIRDVSGAKMPHVYYFRMFLKRRRVFVVNESAKSNQNKQATSGTLNFCSSILTGTI